MTAWIPVTERLPDDRDQLVIAASSEGDVFPVWWTTRGRWMNVRYEHLMDSPTHWMPLPEHPEKATA